MSAGTMPNISDAVRSTSERAPENIYAALKSPPIEELARTASADRPRPPTQGAWTNVKIVDQ